MIWKMNQNLFPFQNTSKYHIYFCKLSTALQTMQYIYSFAYPFGHKFWLLSLFWAFWPLYIFSIGISSYKIPLVMNNIFGDCQLLLHKITSKLCNCRAVSLHFVMVSTILKEVFQSQTHSWSVWLVWRTKHDEHLLWNVLH